MYIQRLEEIDVSFNDRVGLERYVRCTWAIHIYMHHVLRTNLSDSFVQKVNIINEELGIPVETINLNEYKDNYRLSNALTTVIKETEFPIWIWFYGVEALRNSDFAGWLRTKLTVRKIANLRVIFVAGSHEDYREVFCDINEPFYQSTMLLRTYNKS